MSWFFKKSVASILAKFQSTIDELDAHAHASLAKVDFHKAQADEHLDAASDHRGEAAKAAAVVSNLRTLIS